MKHRKKLIEVALPLEAINQASEREGYIYRGNPSALHKWWAQRPMAAARAVIFAQMMDDPSEHPDRFPTEGDQNRERERLFRLIEELVKWENTTNEELLEQARKEIRLSWRRICEKNQDHPRAEHLFHPDMLPGFADPFAGSGVLPLEAQRLGFRTYAGDLNPVAVLISKAMIEIPPKFAGRPPVNPEARDDDDLFEREWKGADGLAEDVRYYGEWMRERVQERIGHLYPKVRITPEMVEERPDLKDYEGRELTVIAWLWARTVRSPNPAFSHVHVPLVSNFMLSTKKGKEAYVDPIVDGDEYRFEVRKGKPENVKEARRGTKEGRGANFRCVVSDSPIDPDFIYSEANAGRMGSRLMAIVLEGDRERVYTPPLPNHTEAAKRAEPDWKPSVEMPDNPRWFSPPLYGLKTYGDLFTPRQLVALNAFSELAREAREKIQRDGISAGMGEDDCSLADGGRGVVAYGESVVTYLMFARDKAAEYGCTLVPWYTKEDRAKGLFARQAIPMVWDFAEVNPLGKIGGTFLRSVHIVSGALGACAPENPAGEVFQEDSVRDRIPKSSFVSTDPPYYDNIGYADLSDFFYVWLRRSLSQVFPDLFLTLAVPKEQELVATPYRHDSMEEAERFFLEGMKKALHGLAERTHPAIPLTIYYAFRQSEKEESSGRFSTGWEAFLDAVIHAGLTITGTWPIRTERGARSIGIGSNALASSIVLVCRPRAAKAAMATRREFLTSLKRDLPNAIADLQRGNIAPVDLAQASIGPGMAIFTRYSQVKESDGSNMSVRTALQLINQALDETLAEQEGDFDADTRWAVAWFSEFGMEEGPYGRGETLSKAKNTSVAGMVNAGILSAGRGKVRLIRRDEMDPEWDPRTDSRLTIWEVTQHLIRSLETRGETAAAELLGRIGGGIGETARELAYRLYGICEKKKWAQEAIAYNTLVTAWPEISRLSREVKAPEPEQMEAF